MEKKHYCDCLDFLQKSAKEEIKIWKRKTCQRFCLARSFVGCRHWCLVYPNLKSVVTPFQSTINSGFRLRGLQNINFCCYPYIELIQGGWLSIHLTDSRWVAIHTLNRFKVCGSFHRWYTLWLWVSASLNLKRWSSQVVLINCSLLLATDQVRVLQEMFICRYFNFI